MPTTKQRINLAVSDDLYARIQAYKKHKGIYFDTSACIQLMTQMLDIVDHKRTKRMLKRTEDKK